MKIGHRMSGNPTPIRITSGGTEGKRRMSTYATEKCPINRSNPLVSLLFKALACHTLLTFSAFIYSMAGYFRVFICLIDLLPQWFVLKGWLFDFKGDGLNIPLQHAMCGEGE